MTTQPQRAETGGTVVRIDGLLDAMKAAASGSQFNGIAVRVDPDTEYSLGGLAAAVVDRVAETSTAKGWRVALPNDATDDVANDELSRLRTQEIFGEALRIARIRGAAAILIFTEDAPSLSTPLEVDNVGTVVGLRVYDYKDMKPSDEKHSDPTKENYGDPIRYEITVEQGMKFWVHESRLIKVTGAPRATNKMNGSKDPRWVGRSALDERTMEAIHSYQRGVKWSERLLERKQQGIYKMAGMGETLALGEEGQQLVEKRISLTDWGRNTLNSVVVDGDDDYTVLNLGVSGIGEVMVELKANVSACTCIPRSILFGESPTGLQSTGKSETEAYHGTIRNVQRRSLLPGLEYLTQLIYAQSDVEEPERWQIEFNALWDLTEVDEADIKQKKATAFKTTVEGLAALDAPGIMDRDELRNAAAITLPQLKIEPGSAAPEPEPLDDEPGTGGGPAPSGT